MLTTIHPYRMREASAEDAPIISEHRALMFRDMGLLDDAEMRLVRKASELWMSELLREGSYLGWLIVLEGDIVGGGGMHLATFGPKPGFCAGGTGAHVANVYVEPEHRRRRLAETLMKQMVEFARSNGISEITLSASEQARPLYDRLGFVHNADFYVLKF